jgi:hypothetical protein
MTRNDEVPWDQIPLVVLFGIVMGLIILWIAIRYMIRKK